MIPLRLRFLALLVALAALLLVAGCGVSGDEKDSGSDDTAAETQTGDDTATDEDTETEELTETEAETETEETETVEVFGEEEAIRDTVIEFAEAARGGDFDRVCDLLSSEAKRQVEQSGQDCVAILKQAGASFMSEIPPPDEITVTDIVITGDMATATVDDEESSFVMEGGEWKVSPE